MLNISTLGMRGFFNVIKESKGAKILNRYNQWDMPYYTTITNFSTKYLVMRKVYTDVSGIK